MDNNKDGKISFSELLAHYKKINGLTDDVQHAPEQIVRDF